MKNKFIEYFKDESGQTTTEYLLLVAVVVAIIFKFKEKFTTAMDKILQGVFENGQIDDLLQGR